MVAPCKSQVHTDNTEKLSDALEYVMNYDELFQILICS